MMEARAADDSPKYLSAVIIILLSIHAWSQRDSVWQFASEPWRRFKNACLWTTASEEASTDPHAEVRREQVSAAIRQTRVKNFEAAMTWSWHIYWYVLLAGLLLVNFFPWMKANEGRGALSVSTVFYCLCLPWGAGWVKVTESTARWMLLSFQLVYLARIITMTRKSPDMYIFLGVRTLMRILFGLLTLDLKQTSAMNIVMSAAAVWRSCDSYQALLSPAVVASTARFDIVIFVAEAATLALIIVCCWTFEASIHDKVSALLQAKASQNSYRAAHKLVSVTCDADALLSPDLEIVGCSPKLSHLLMTGSGNSSALNGKRFTTFLTEPDQQRFHDFIEISSRHDLECGEHDSMPASSLHVRVKGAAGVTFKAELFHAVVQSLDGDQRPNHLLGIKEEEEREERANVDQTAEQGHDQVQDEIAGLGPFLQDVLGFPDRAPSRVGPASCHSGSSSSSASSRGAAAEPMPELQKLEIVVDVFSQELRIQKVAAHFDLKVGHQRLPHLIDWLTQKSKTPVYAWLQDHANAMFGGTELPEPISPVHLRFPGREDSVLVAGSMVCVELEDEDEDGSKAEDEEEEEEDSEDEESPFLLQVELTQFSASQSSSRRSRRHGSVRSSRSGRSVRSQPQFNMPSIRESRA